MITVDGVACGDVMLLFYHTHTHTQRRIEELIEIFLFSLDETQ